MATSFSPLLEVEVVMVAQGGAGGARNGSPRGGGEEEEDRRGGKEKGGGMDSTFFFFFEKVWEGRGLEGFKAGIGKKPFLIYNSVGEKQEGGELLYFHSLGKG